MNGALDMFSVMSSTIPLTIAFSAILLLGLCWYLHYCRRRIVHYLIRLELWWNRPSIDDDNNKTLAYRSFERFIHERHGGTQTTTDLYRFYSQSLPYMTLPPFNTTLTHLTIGRASACWVHCRGTDSKRTDKICIYFGAGALLGLPPALEDGPAAHFAQSVGARMLCVSLPHPHESMSFLEDAVGVYHWVSRYHQDSSIIVIGASSGGTLTLLLLQELVRSQFAHQPVGAVLISPWTDLLAQSPSIIRNLESDCIFGHGGRPNTEAVHHVFDDLMPSDARFAYSPLTGNCIGLPPLYFLVGGSEVFVDDTSRFVVKARNAGVNVEAHVEPGMCHIYPFFPTLFPEAELAHIGIRRFMASVFETDEVVGVGISMVAVGVLDPEL